MAEIDDRPGSREPRASGRAGAFLKLAVLVLLLAGGYLAATRTPLGSYLTREGIGEAIALLRGNPWAPLIFMATYATATALAVPGTILTLAGGALFGFYWGTFFNFVAANIGANAAFVLARTLGGDGVRRLMGDDSAALQKLDDVVGKHGFQGLLTLRLIPLVPFNALNFGSGLMSLKWRTYALATLIGILPGTAVYTFFADSLLQGSQEASRDALVRVLIAGGLLLLLSLLPAILKRLGVRLPGMSAVLVLLMGLSLAARPASAMQQTSAAGLPDHSAFTPVLAAVVEEPLVNYARLAAEPRRAEPLHRSPRLHRPLGSCRSQPQREARLLDQRLQRLHAQARDRALPDPEGGRPAPPEERGRRPAGEFRLADRRCLHRGALSRGRRRALPGRNRTRDHPSHGRPAHPLRDQLRRSQLSAPHLPGLSGRHAGRAAGTAAYTHSSAIPPTSRSRSRMARPPSGVNRVLDWFSEDFGGSEGIVAFLAGYVEGAARAALTGPDARLVFFDYDWTLNDATR